MTGTQTLLTVALQRESDVVAARQRARELAGLLRFEPVEQTRIATAVSELARNAFLYAGGGLVSFSVEPEQREPALWVVVSDRGPGIANLKAVLSGTYQSSTGMGLGIIGAKRLMDAFQVDSRPGEGTTVRMAKMLPRGAASPDVPDIAAKLARHAPPSPLTEVEQQNRELLQTLSELKRRQEELSWLNRELTATNRGVVALYAELDDRAERLKRADEVKSRFLSYMSHEFRTPLISSQSLCRLLLEEDAGPLTEEQVKQVRLIQKSQQELLELVNDLLDLAKVEAGKTVLRPSAFRVADLFATMRGMFRAVVPGGRVLLRIDDSEELPEMFTDEQRLGQILRNLLSNALKFTERGEVRLWAEPVGGGARVAFYVQDSGIGIPVDEQERIFEEFSQVESAIQKRSKGTGLGLPLSRRLAALLGGGITVRSAPGEGSTFRVEVPARLGSGAAEVEVAAPAARPRDRKVLVIDDDEASRYLVNHALQGTRFQVLEAPDARVGIERACAERPDVIVLDLVMPGIDGMAAMEQLKRDHRTREIPVVIYTSGVLSSEQESQLGRHAALILRKGGSREELTDSIASLAGESGRSGERP
ncbi:MAG: response regulator [Bryobacteraceae bacterium]|nr:response regulator [Bryobacteraceae bacterium]